MSGFGCNQTVLLHVPERPRQRLRDACQGPTDPEAGAILASPEAAFLEETPIHSPGDPGLAVYVHIPFCLSRCPYCDFNTYTGMQAWVPSYIRALCREAAQVADAAGGSLIADTVYIGGGTPSILPPGVLLELMEGLRSALEVPKQAEMTIEVNPGDASAAWMAAARQAGFSRLSLGMQSADARVLTFLGRRHAHADTVAAVGLARQAGFENISLDLIYGVPGQSLDSWMETVDQALGFEPDHLSAYALTVEAGTPLGDWVSTGLVSPPDDDLAADMVEWLEERLDRAGFLHYEISNWGRRLGGDAASAARVSQHNLRYWRNQPYLGLGAGAHGYAGGLRYANAGRIPDYLTRLGERDRSPRFPLSSAVCQWRCVEPDEAARDSMLLGLRLTAWGVERDGFVARHGLPAWQALQPAVDGLILDGLLEWFDSGRRLRLTRRGRQVGNRVFQAFV